MKNILFVVTLLLSAGLLIADDHKKMPGEMKKRMFMVKLKMDLAELKGPPSLADLEKKQTNRIADLDLLINSGKYESVALERLTNMRERLVTANLPSQEELNQRHDRRLKKMKSKMKSRVKMMDRKFREPGRPRDMRDRKRWETKQQRNRNKD
tara:strand:+ start:165 stop:623 length:459 start_codon:yes stop_codon:yes gene_type:complete